MKLALITTPPSVNSGIGDYTRHLLAELSRHAQIELFVEHGREGETLLGRKMRSVRTLEPRAFDTIVYQLGNEIAHAFMKPLLRRIGGTVVLHDWILFDMSLAAHPALARGGIKGLALAWREGGSEQARVYLENRLAQRAAPGKPKGAIDAEQLDGTLLDGWHESEPSGRWTSDLARLRLSASAVERVVITVVSEPGRRIDLSCEDRRAQAHCTNARRECELELDLRGLQAPLLVLAVNPLFLSDEQQRNGDTRRLGAFVKRIRVCEANGEHDLDLRSRAAAPLAPMGLFRDRFSLSLNRGIVRSADAFIVHSEFVREKIVRERGAAIPVAVVRHGAEPRWSDEPRALARTRLKLPADWRDCVLLTSFGSLQAHKRVEPLLQAFAVARSSRADLRLALIGAEDRETLDVQALVRSLGLEGCVRLTGRVEESEAWTWIHAGDLAVQLRGPSTGGSSGGVFQSLALGRAVIASDLDEQRELPADCVLRVAPGPDEVEHLSRLIFDLAGDPARRVRLELGARRFVENECSWARVAALYAENLARFPRARASS